ncbi:hypothetical protein WS72_28025 [Burkholderia savannae]|uniref:Uncharacterized protein n=2 Tax=Burkholderiaceae TaxID=119060 RepID=A0ABR5T623_9BURK|nr:hypothetical protein WS72_28025 [Burkholderia savannae]KWZ47264.1 hypothetical protein WS73_01280 [Burkholderia savannae]
MPLEGRFFVAFLRGVAVREPVTLRQVWALITEPAPGQEVQCGELAIRGVAWSGAGPIARVEASVGDRKAGRKRISSASASVAVGNGGN